MIDACKAFLKDRLNELILEDESPAYDDGKIFFGNMPRDYLKDNDYAANCLMLQDRKKKDGKTVSRVRDEECETYTFTRKRFSRTVLFRCFLYAKNSNELWGTDGYTGLVDQLEQKIAQADRVIADSNNNAVKIELHDAVTPWDADGEEEANRLKRRPHRGIVRVTFTGGVYASWTVPIIPDIEITPAVDSI